MKNLIKAIATLSLGMGVLLVGFWFSAVTAHADGTVVRWDIVSIQPPPPVAPRFVLPGGMASARANDNSKITLTGSGTFVRGEDGQVTGGGTWKTFDPAGNPTGNGTYTVTGFVSFLPAPGVSPTGNIDLIDPHPVSAGLAFLKIAYSDDDHGILVVSCHLMGTPDSVFEGITASKGFVDFWNREAPASNIDANRTVFHIISQAD